MMSLKAVPRRPIEIDSDLYEPDSTESNRGKTESNGKATFQFQASSIPSRSRGPLTRSLNRLLLQQDKVIAIRDGEAFSLLSLWTLRWYDFIQKGIVSKLPKVRKILTFGGTWRLHKTHPIHYRGRKNESNKGANRVSVMSFSRSATLLTSLPCSLVSASQYPDIFAWSAKDMHWQLVVAATALCFDWKRLSPSDSASIIFDNQAGR